MLRTLRLNFSVIYHLNITCSLKQDLPQPEIKVLIYGLLLYMPRYEHLRVRWNSPSEYLDKNVPTHFRYCKKDPPHWRVLHSNFLSDGFKF